MRARIIPAFLTAALLSTTFLAAAECEPTTSRAQLCSITLGALTGNGCVATDVAGTIYLDNHDCLPVVDELATCAWDLWIYVESNGIPGLQRGDALVDDTCGGKIASDTLVF